jgi:hypothetical protein
MNPYFRENESSEASGSTIRILNLVLERCRRPDADLSAHRAQRSRRGLGQTLRQLARKVQRRGVSGLAGHGLGVRK